MSNEKTLYKIVGKRIAELREIRGHSQQTVANKTDLNRATISNIELGRQNVSLHIIYEIAKALQTEPAYFLPNLNEIPDVESSTENIEKILNKEPIDENTKNAILKLIKRSEND